MLSLENLESSPHVATRLWRRFVERLVDTLGAPYVHLTETRADQTVQMREVIIQALAGADDLGGADSEEGADSEGGLIGMIMAEPYYHCCAGRASLSALLFYAQVRVLRPLCHPEGCAVVPRRAVLTAVGIRFGSLGRAHGLLGRGVCGLDHSALDEAWASWHRSPYVYHLWQYEHQVVSATPLVLLTLDYEAAAAAGGALGWAADAVPVTHTMHLRPGATGIDAVAVTVDFGLGPAGDTPHDGHEVFFLPQRREGDAPLMMSATVEGGALKLEFC